MTFTLDDLKQENLLLQCISGSKAYGLNTPTSDTDIRGVFVLPEEDYFGLDEVEQLHNESQDIVYYELKRFVALLYKNNPNMLELLHMPKDCVLYKHPLYDWFKPEDFLSRQCQASFAGYALTQIKKARGLNKKILNPVEPERKSVLDFCYVVQGQGAVPLLDFLQAQGLTQDKVGLANIPHMHELYGLFYDANHAWAAPRWAAPRWAAPRWAAPRWAAPRWAAPRFKGIVQSDQANDVSLSSIPKGLKPLAYMSFNKSGYSTYCKAYREYWDWVDKRNDARYQNTLSHGKNYDAKNLMHTFRLLDMAEEIGKEGKIIVRRPNREFLLKVKSGAFAYEELLAIAEERIAGMEALYAKSDLPEMPDREKINKVLVRVRKEFYQKK